MNKNVSVACGLGDLFTFFTRLDDFFDTHPEYKSISFWTWLHTPGLAQEMAEYVKHDVDIFTVKDMTEYLEKLIPAEQLDGARNHFIKQHSGGVGVDKYMKFLNTFFPHLEEWIYLPVYEKYKSTYPFMLDVPVETYGKPYIIIHPFSATVKTEKEERTWSPHRWAKVVDMILKYTTVDVFIIGAKSDKIEVGKVFKDHERLYDMRGEWSFSETISYIYGAKAVLGINSWPTFMALWAEIPTYSQWFVQHQLIPSHHPKPVEELEHLVIEYNRTQDPSEIRYYHPTAAQAWEGIRKVLDYAECPL